MRDVKDFSTHAEQLGILEERGLKVTDKVAAKRILSRENYYALIDGYKEPFLEHDEWLNPYGLERYQEGTEFGHIYALHSFDRKLRLLLLNELLKFEKNIKSKVAYRFSEKFKDMASFLNSDNYSSDSRHHHERDRIISILANLIQSHKKRDKVRYPAIREFYDKHKDVPLWVLVNFLSLGQITHFYTVIDEELRERIAGDFVEEYSEEYGPVCLKASDLDAILHTVFPYRNKSAHEEVLYRFRLAHPVELGTVEWMLEMEKGSLSEATVLSVVCLLKLVLEKEDYELFSSELEQSISELKKLIQERAFVKIMKDAGFDGF
ncbi:Abi family protein [Planococcus antarcticus DSM 14505]|uniref:Abi family protein n=1 Tax=Planococcus antarcticus DSM 14505 TaxID=1185653 RepID=A0A1C7DK88_9BACL|nr:Abi family protein [Planococcus antarcticus]ANU11875.1 DNA-binding protein [Planococcus antarcticus DSM 14505]EIM06984.1 Abi family protein [Planococcus antarcticus DSM 14505]